MLKRAVDNQTVSTRPVEDPVEATLACSKLSVSLRPLTHSACGVLFKGHRSGIVGVDAAVVLCYPFCALWSAGMGGQCLEDAFTAQLQQRVR